MSEVFKKLQPGAHIHLMGICGTAMASLAGMLKDLGFKVTGSDQNVYPPMSTQLQELGISIMEGYKKENLEPRPDLVIVGNVISKHFPEAEALLASDVPYTSLPAALGKFAIGQGHSIVVAGTHGKTTTTSMMAWMAESSHLHPGFLIGGIPANFPRSFRAPNLNPNQKHWFIIEGDEYDTAFFDKVPKFIHYRPKYVILTSIEFDHADIYDDLEQVKEAFVMLLTRIPEDGILVYKGDDKNIQSILSHCRSRKVAFGLESGDYRAVQRQVIQGRNQFAVERKGERIADLALKMYGQHNTLNALAAFTLATELSWPETEVLQALASFTGVKRRQEIIGEPRGITVIEDFAHHPTSVGLTIDSLRELYPGRKVIAVFEPRSATSRRKIFQQDYINALKKADQVVLPPAYHKSKSTEENQFSSQEVIDSINNDGGHGIYCVNADAIVDELRKSAQPNDVILIMSNGGFDGIYSKLLPALEQN